MQFGNNKLFGDLNENRKIHVRFWYILSRN